MAKKQKKKASKKSSKKPVKTQQKVSKPPAKATRKKAPPKPALYIPWPKYLAKYPISTIATFLGLEEKQARYYRKSGRLPKRLKSTLPHIHKIKPPTRERIKSILTRSPEVLADLADTTVKNAKSWIKNKTIPVDHREFLIDLYPEEDSEPIQAEEVKFKESKNFLFYTYVWQVHRKLTDSLVIELTTIIENLTLIKQSAAQVKIIFRAKLNFEDEILKYMLVAYQFNQDEKSVDAMLEIYTPLYSQSRDLAIATKKVLTQLFKRDSTVQTLTMFYRVRKNWL